MCKKFLCYILIILLIACAFPVSTMVFAEDRPEQPDPTLMGREVLTTEMSDTRLYHSLLVIYNKYYGLPKKENGIVVTPRATVLTRNMFVNMDFAFFDYTLNLAGTSRASNGISSLDGLNLIDFSECKNLNKVDLSYNDLSSDVSAFQLMSIAHVKELDISNNKLSNIDLSSFDNLTKINLSNNQFSTIDLSMVRSDTEPASINLSGNEISKVEDISLRREELLENEIYIYLLDNDISTFARDTEKIKYNFGIFGLKESNKYGTNEQLILGKIDQISNISTASDIILLARYEENLEPVPNFRYVNSELTDDIRLTEVLPIGKYQLYYVNQDGQKLEEAMFASADKPLLVEILPSVPTAVLNSEVVSTGINTYVKEDSVLKLSSNDSSAKFYYKINGSEWIEGNEIKIEANQSGWILYRAEINGVFSENGQITLLREKSFTTQDFFGIMLIILAMLGVIYGLMPLARYFFNKPINLGKNRNKKV